MADDDSSQTRRWLDDEVERQERQASLAQLVAGVDRRRTDVGAAVDDDPGATVQTPRRAGARTDDPTQRVAVTSGSGPSAPTARTERTRPETTRVLDTVDDAPTSTRSSEWKDVHPTRTRRRQRPRRRWRLKVLSTLILFAIGYYAVTLAQVWATGRTDDRDPVDAIVVMGAAQYDGRPSPQLEDRLDHAVELWPQGVAPTIVVTGGNRPGDRFTEAGASAQYLVEQGIPESAILLEDQGSNSYESLASVASILAERGLDEVVIVSDPYHALRSRLIADEVGLDASVSSTTTSVVTGADSAIRHAKEAGGVAVGRIIGFRRLTDLVG